jgi:hypothetical protein
METWMTKVRATAAIVAMGVVLAGIPGCSGSTASSRQPSQDEIQKGIERRLADVDKQPGLTPEMKERMKAQIRGSSQPQGDRAKTG